MKLLTGIRNDIKNIQGLAPNASDRNNTLVYFIIAGVISVLLIAAAVLLIILKDMTEVGYSMITAVSMWWLR